MPDLLNPTKIDMYAPSSREKGRTANKDSERQ